MKMRDGPGANHGLIGAIPAGETVNASRCVPRDDRIPGADSCLVYYRGMTGWVSQAGLMPVNVGTWTAPPRPAPTPAPSNADLHFSLICGAPHMMGGGPDPDPVLSVAVSWTAGRWSVTHTTLRRNVYNREAQYAMADNSDDRVARWSGTRIKNGNNYYMVGEATYTRSGQYVYRETLYANGRLDMKSEAICQPEPPVVARGGGGWDEAPAPSAPIIDSVPLYPTEGGRRHKLDVLIGGASVRMLYDTGATVSLINSGIAQKIVGANVGTWGPMTTIQTANDGMMKLPSLTVREIRIGSHTVSNVQFAVGDTEHMIIAGPVLNSIGTVTIDANGGQLVFNR
jgi:hypothetical protein